MSNFIIILDFTPFLVFIIPSHRIFTFKMLILSTASCYLANCVPMTFLQCAYHFVMKGVMHVHPLQKDGSAITIVEFLQREEVVKNRNM